MSGSDRPGSSIGRSSSQTSCDTISFETPISSPKPDIISQLQVGHQLHVALNTQSGINTVVLLHNGEIVGGIVEKAETLKSCMENGFSYYASVREINGGFVKVFIQPE